MAERIFLDIADGYLRETNDPGRCAMIMLLTVAGRVTASKTPTGYRDLEAV